MRDQRVPRPINNYYYIPALWQYWDIMLKC